MKKHFLECATIYFNINPLAFKKKRLCMGDFRTSSLPNHSYTNCSIQLNANDIRMDLHMTYTVDGAQC